jgi:MoxR-like ATPase
VRYLDFSPPAADRQSQKHNSHDTITHAHTFLLATHRFLSTPQTRSLACVVPSVRRKLCLGCSRAAMVSGRPLLIRGEAGIGKTQLARAAAEVLQVPLLHHVIDERTERDDLLYHYDAVARLAAAQIAAIVEKETPGTARQMLQERNFIRPGIFWWAINWSSAATQALNYETYCRPCGQPGTVAFNLEAPCSCVMLIDEIDKADPSVPNGLLECLGSDGFRTPLIDEGVHVPADGKPPLVILTTNEERELPLAFLRRCLVLTIPFPKDEAAARKLLIEERAPCALSL